jgi:hypothetical protein
MLLFIQLVIQIIHRSLILCYDFSHKDNGTILAEEEMMDLYNVKDL